MRTAADWYRASYPRGPQHDPRCLAVIAAIEPGLYNLHPVGENAPDGGFRQCRDGLTVTLRGGSLSTFDDDGLTRLVLAAHAQACRVDVRASGGNLVVQVNPRSPEPDKSLYDRHPTLDDLAKRCVA